MCEQETVIIDNMNKTACKNFRSMKNGKTYTSKNKLPVFMN